MTRFLVVANQTLSGDDLFDVIEDRIGAGGAEFWVLVPQPATQHPSGAVGQWPGPSPQAREGFSEEGPSTGPAGDALSRGEERLTVALERIRSMGGTAQGGAVAQSDPFRAIESVLAEQQFDEIILSTLPARVSAWLHLDLPNRLARKFPGRVTTVTARRHPKQ